jgi:hypothetical protein
MTEHRRRSVTLTASLPVGTVAEIDAIAEQQDSNVSAVVRELVQDALARRKAGSDGN